MRPLTDKQIEAILNIGYGVKTDTKVIQIDREVLYSLMVKMYTLGANNGVMTTKWKD